VGFAAIYRTTKRFSNWLVTNDLLETEIQRAWHKTTHQLLISSYS